MKLTTYKSLAARAWKRAPWMCTWAVLNPIMWSAVALAPSEEWRTAAKVVGSFGNGFICISVIIGWWRTHMELIRLRAKSEAWAELAELVAHAGDEHARLVLLMTLKPKPEEKDQLN